MGASALSPLTAAQREIMQIVWDRGEVTVSEVRDALAGRRELARNTVQTMMARLEEVALDAGVARGRSPG